MSKDPRRLIRGDVVVYAGDRWTIIKLLDNKQYVLRHTQRLSRTTVATLEKCSLVG